MIHTKSPRLIAASLTTLAALLVQPVVAAQPQPPTAGEYIDDAAITARIKAKYVESKTVNASTVSVETQNGEVILSGFAKNSEEKTQAEALARQVKGVREVKNALEVRK